jgi:hypothetical protein
MKTHGQKTYVALHARTATADRSPGAPRTDRLIRTARGLVVVSLVLGSLGASEAESLSLASPGHAGDHQLVSTVRAAKHAKTTSPIHTGFGISGPWMY